MASVITMKEDKKVIWYFYEKGKGNWGRHEGFGLSRQLNSSCKVSFFLSYFACYIYTKTTFLK
jgi:hypothetical protein